MIWFIASVWIDHHDDPLEARMLAHHPLVLRMQARDVEHYAERVRDHVDAVYGQGSHVTIGPISRSKVQSS